MAAPGSAKYVALVGMVALLTAGLLLLARIFKLGFLADFLSRTVLVGFLAGVGCQVGIAMLPDMLGVTVAAHRTLGQAWELLQGLERRPACRRWHCPCWWPAAFCSASGSCRDCRCRWSRSSAPSPRAPRSTSPQRGIAVIGPVPGGLPSIGLPIVTWSETLALLPVAASCFVMIITQSAATSRVFAERYHERVDANADILGLSAANAAAAFSGTFVVNGSPTQTAMADRAGARSQVRATGVRRRRAAGAAGADRPAAVPAALRAGRHRVHHRGRHDRRRRRCATSAAKAPASSISPSPPRRRSSRSASSRASCWRSRCRCSGMCATAIARTR